MDPDRVSIELVHPSQFYLNIAKLQSLMRTFVLEEIEPFPVIIINGMYVLTDKHHTLFIALLMGCKEIIIYDDTESVDIIDYKYFVEECQKREVNKIGDLVGRLLSNEKYKELWLEWCEKYENSKN